MERLRRIVEDSNTVAGRAFDLVVQGLIVISLVAFSIETLPDLSESDARALRVIEVVTVIVFTGEYLLRLLVARHKLRFVFSFFGIVDILSILPFYLATGLDLRTIRSIRLLRLFRVLKLARYGRAMRRFQIAFGRAKEELALFLFATTILLYLASVGIYYFENDAQPDAFSSVFTSLWWAVATLTTVGYGDVYPTFRGLRTGFLGISGSAMFGRQLRKSLSGTPRIRRTSFCACDSSGSN